jgi:hypothetical protein
VGGRRQADENGENPRRRICGPRDQPGGVFPDPQGSKENTDAAEPKEPARKTELFIGQSDSLLVVGTVLKDIEKVLASQGGGSISALADQAAFSSSYNSLFRDAQAFGWINLKPVVDAIAKSDAKEAAEGRPNRPQQPMGMSASKLMSSLGFTGLQALAGSLRDTADGCVINMNVNAPESGRRGLVKALSFETKAARFAEDPRHRGKNPPRSDPAAGGHGEFSVGQRRQGKGPRFRFAEEPVWQPVG